MKILFHAIAKAQKMQILRSGVKPLCGARFLPDAGERLSGL
jgi:hypothetical protein